MEAKDELQLRESDRSSPNPENNVNSAVELAESFAPCEAWKVESNRGLSEQTTNEYPHGAKLFALILALMLATFMVSLDTSVIGKLEFLALDSPYRTSKSFH